MHEGGNQTKTKGFPALLQQFTEVAYLDIERKKLQAVADEAKATRLMAEKVRLQNLQIIIQSLIAFQKVADLGGSHDPSCIPVMRQMPECY